MRISYNWLQTFFADNLPPPAEVAELIAKHIFEVEEVISTDNDTVLELDVLPNRAGDCLSHRGLALELSAILNLPLVVKDISAGVVDATVPAVAVDLKSEACNRYLGLRVENIKVEPSPRWLADKITTMDGRSINNIVDLTNFALFELGQPLHAFDADKVKGGITVRGALPGEQMETLDGKSLSLTSADVVIADEAGALALAGVKGGKRAEVDTQTKNIILESASFLPAVVRQATVRHNLRTDASKRFENNLAPETAEAGLNLVVSKLAELLPEAKFSAKTDIFPQPKPPTQLTVKLADISTRLGVEVAQETILDILERLRFAPVVLGEEVTITIPFDRRDILGRDDVVEEIGRMFGYDKIPAVLPAPFALLPDDELFTSAQTLRQLFLESGWSEIYGYTFTERGQVELANPLAKDKPFLRTNLTDNLLDKIKLNLRQVLFETEPVKIFDIGTVFTAEREKMSVAVGVGFTKDKFLAKDESFNNLLLTLTEKLGVKIELKMVTEGNIKVVEFDLDLLLDKQDWKANLEPFLSAPETVFKPISSYPRIIRDIALFVPAGTSSPQMGEMIKQNAGKLLAEGPVLFDEFTKDGENRTSLAFRLVFQAYDRTLEDKEVNELMEKITIELEKNQDFEVRK